MRRLPVVVGLILASLWAARDAGAEPARIVGYYTSWSIYARDYHVADIPADRITHINYAFANIRDGEIVLGDPYADTDRFYPGDSWDPDSLRGCFHQLQILKRAHPGLRTLISVGGWTWSGEFSDVALTPASRARFASSCVAFIQRYGFDGVDIDWEYPVSGGLPGNTQRPEDKRNFTLLLEELRAQLDAAGDHLLTIAATASPVLIENLEVDLIHPRLDWINVMTYDFHGPWGGESDPVTHFNAALHAAPDDPLPEPYRSWFNLEAAVGGYLDRGVPPAKLHAGLPFYGRGYGGVQGGDAGLFAAYAGPAPCGTWENGVFDFWDLAAHYVDRNGYVAARHPQARVPWLHHPQQRIMISYDDSLSISEKCRFSLDRGLGGVMFWEFSADRDSVLARAADDALAGAPGDAPGHGPPPHGLWLRCAPNPSSGAVRFLWDEGPRMPVRLLIFDAAGRLVRSLDAPAARGIVWDGCDARGAAVGAGAYVWRAGPGTGGARGRLVRIR